MPYLHYLILCALVSPRHKFRLWAKAIYLPFGRCDIISLTLNSDISALLADAICRAERDVI